MALAGIKLLLLFTLDLIVVVGDGINVYGFWSLVSISLDLLR